MAKLNVFITTLYSFFPLVRLKEYYKGLFSNQNVHNVPSPNLMKYLEPKYSYVPLSSGDLTCYYEYDYQSVHYKRCVDLKCWLVKYKSNINTNGTYYLVTTIGIDKAFDYANKTQFALDDLCTAKDLVFLKRAFYGHDSSLYYIDKGTNRGITIWLNHIIEKITGRNPQGHFNRHYIVDACGVDLWQNKNFLCRGKKLYTKNELEDTFSKFYYRVKRYPYEEVIDDSDKLVYGLIYGNENNDVIPDDNLEKILSNSFSNNISERIFAYHKTEVFLHTHFPWSWIPKHKGKKKKLNVEPLKDIIVYDMLIVMDAKRKLKRIERTLNLGRPSDIKDALASISNYLNTNPYHLGEYTLRIQMLYSALGVTQLLDSVKKRGGLLADSRNIEMQGRLNFRVYLLTGVTALIGIFSLIVSILCCNNNCSNTNQSSDMGKIILDGNCSLNGCCAIFGVLLGLVVAASIIVTAVYQIRSYKKLKDIETEVKKLGN